MATGETTVAAVVSPEAVALADGRTLRLADIRAADPPAMTAALAEWVGVRVRVTELVPGARDRWGRAVGDLVPARADARNATGAGVSAAVLARGLALVDPAAMSGACVAELFGVERTAEAERRGVWRAGLVVPATGTNLTTLRGRYILVDGAVLSVGETRRTTYLNFGDKWRSDFTALIRRRDGDDDPAARALSGRRVRVRGVLEAWNGGLIRIEHPAQVELR